MTAGRKATREVRSIHRYLPTVYTDQMMVNFVCGCWQGSRAESFNYDCPAHKAGREATACAGWEDEGSPAPTCFPLGCERLDENGSCPGTAGREAARSTTEEERRG